MREETSPRCTHRWLSVGRRRMHLPVFARPLLRTVLWVLMLLSLSGCGRASGSLERVQAEGVLRVASDPSFPPFEFVNPAGEMDGLDVDLARAVAEHLGVQAHFVTTGYDALYDALTAGRADVIVSALYPDPARSQGFHFSHAYFNAGYVLVVREGSDVAALDDLAGRSVACTFGTTGHVEVLHLMSLMASPPVVLTVDDPIALLQLLYTGEADAVVTDRVSALMAASKDATLRILDPPVTDEPYVMAVRKEDSSLARAIDEALEVLDENGTLTELLEMWMKP
jgi:ABC-type amino acid transport substrate-binding protein